MSESNLRKCMCCGRMVSYTFAYCRPGPKSVHHAEWCVDVLELCPDCGREWTQHFPPDIETLSEEECEKMISNANKWLFDKVAKQLGLVTPKKKFDVRGFHDTPDKGHCCCRDVFEAENLREATFLFFEKFPNADELFLAKELKETES